jgi:hypothetical protein
MPGTAENAARGALANLQRFAQKTRTGQEFCELCATPLAPEHQHLFELKKRSITCACDPCAILFVDNVRQSYRRIPRDVRRLRDFRMDDEQWDSLLIPIKLAFFVYSTTAGRVIAQYPSPAGAMESSLDLQYWDEIVKHNPVLKQFAPDVEALLVNRVCDPAQYYRAPIDQCYRLVGLIRTHWRGLSGGSEVWRRIQEFFQQLDERSGGPRA